MSVKLEHVTVGYGRRPVLHDVSLDCDRGGRIIGLFGPNGAGKTTMMRVIVGLLGRFTGARSGCGPKDVAYLPDYPFLYRDLRLEQAVRVYAARYRDFRVDVARDAFSSLGLDAHLQVRECSKGMSEQLHIGLTLARSPGLYVFDEPLGAVDPATRRRLVEMIRQLRAPESPMLISTHLIDGVSALFDDVVIVNEGRIVLDTTVAEATHGGQVSLEDAFLERVESSDERMG